VARVVLLCAEQPVFVIAAKTRHPGTSFVSKAENGVNAATRIGTSVDVITEKDQDVLFSDVLAQLFEKVEKCCEISVDVSDHHCRHGKEREDKVAVCLAV
jgi:hypothetical protein